MKPAEPQATDIGAVNPVAETSPAEQPAAHPETDVRLLDLNKIVNSTYNPRKNFREDTLLELAESINRLSEVYASKTAVYRAHKRLDELEAVTADHAERLARLEAMQEIKRDCSCER